jgi:mRNA-degrading endonuclease RelE of RelBE toxin-antitoxin system
MPYEIDFAASVKRQLEALTARQRATVLDAIEQQLTHEPLVETRNRKLLRPNPVAPWELRVGQLRVFYEVSASEPESEVAGVVHVLAVGCKKGNVLWIGDRKVDL